MGYGYYTLPDGREAGYNVVATCDKPGCDKQIDRGLAYLCGDAPDGHRDPDEAGCGRYFCTDHESHPDHDCPNPYEMQFHPFVEDADYPGLCGHVALRATAADGRVLEFLCGVPRERHENAEELIAAL